MGLHVLAVNGMLVREARSYILRCHGCFKYVAARLAVPVPVPAGDSPEENFIPHVLSSTSVPAACRLSVSTTLIPGTEVTQMTRTGLWLEGGLGFAPS